MGYLESGSARVLFRLRCVVVVLVDIGKRPLETKLGRVRGQKNAKDAICLFLNTSRIFQFLTPSNNRRPQAAVITPVNYVLKLVPHAYANPLPCHAQLHKVNKLFLSRQSPLFLCQKNTRTQTRTQLQVYQ